MRTLAVMIVAGVAASAHAQVLPLSAPVLMGADSQNDRVLAFSPASGALLGTVLTDSNFLTPVGITQVGSQLWVGDQLVDGIFRYDLTTGAPLGVIGGTPTGGFNNIRGLRLINGVVYVCNADAGNGAAAATIIKVDPASGSIIGTFTTDASPWDVILYNGELLVSSSGTNRIVRHDLATGALLGAFYTPGAIRFPQQMQIVGPSQNLVVSGFSIPDGLYVLNSLGAQINFFDAPVGPRGNWTLGSGNILYGTGSGYRVFDPIANTDTSVATGGGRFLALINPVATSCYANCDGSTTPPILNAGDFGCFISAFRADASLPAAAQVSAYSNCDGSTTPPILNAGDFGCFLTRFRAGCL
jgi:hypothetical protein